jgi:hypothetical protein
MGLYIWAAIILAVLGFLLWLFLQGKSAGKDSVVVDAQEDVIDGQKDINAARVATADTGTGRADRLRERFTRK